MIKKKIKLNNILLNHYNLIIIILKLFKNKSKIKVIYKYNKMIKIFKIKIYKI